MNPLDRPGLLTPKDLAEFLQVSRAALSQWCGRGDLPFIRLGRAVRFYPGVVREWLKHREQGAAPRAPISDPEGIVVPDPECPRCEGKGLTLAGPCGCLRPERQP